MIERNVNITDKTEVPIAQVLVFNHDLESGEITQDPETFTFTPGKGVILKSMSRPQPVEGPMAAARLAAGNAKKRGELVTLALYDQDALSLVLPNDTQIDITLSDSNYSVRMDHVEERVSDKRAVITVGIMGRDQSSINRRLIDWKRVMPRIKTT